MPVNTATAAIHITPVVIKTFFSHAKTKTRKLKDGDKNAVATDDVFFDEAFHIVKAFIDMGTHNTIESLQAFTNTHVPAPPWAAVSPVQIPLQSCNTAADLLIEWFGPEEIKTVVGGEKWWQVRGLDGVDAEWIVQKEFLSDKVVDVERKLNADEADILRMEHLETVMLYVHGGAYFWGSINTHRYQIIRYARKMKGRAFAVNYRKAPQYPWPCPIQDVIAAYLYLTKPPDGALHKAVPPSKIVLAGDSAGAGLCVSVLTVLRDLGLELPAGAVLISPWVDLTHSFPSVMKNTATDIIPPYGFIHKPSELWPMDLLPKAGDGRVVEARTNPPPMPGHADTLKPSAARMSEQHEQQVEQGRDEGRGTPVAAEELHDENVKSQEEMLDAGPQIDNPEATSGHADSVKSVDEKSAHRDAEHPDEAQDPQAGEGANGRADNAKSTDEKDNHQDTDHRTETQGLHVEDDASSDWSTIKGHDDDASYEDALSFWEPKPPKVLMQSPDDTPLEIHSQIQMYATNEQLSHPLVSPVLQASLGNLCPLYIIAGDGEVLRDEIMYLAHKASHPQDYPTRKGVLCAGRRQRENAEKFTTPTKVHLQVFDGMCHVLTVFTFTDCAKYAYRSIAEFAKHVTQNTAEHVARNPFPELHRPPGDISDSSSDEEYEEDNIFSQHHAKEKSTASSSSASSYSSGRFSGLFKREKHATPPAKSQDVRLYEANEEKMEIEVRQGKVEILDVASSGESTPMPVPTPGQSSNGRSTTENSEKAQTAPARSATADDRSTKSSSASGPERDIPNVFMIRERVDIYGRVRPMEPKEEIEALHIPPRQIGIIKEVPVKRWLAGQEAWDKQFRRVALKMMKRRMRYERKYAELLEHAKEQGLELHKKGGSSDPPTDRPASRASAVSGVTLGTIDVERRWGPFDIEGEAPSPTAIVGRRDNSESIALATKNIYFTAPVTHNQVPKRSTGQAVKAAFDPKDHPTKAPFQSVAEEQTESHSMPGTHGMHIWQSLLSYFMKKSSKKRATNRSRQRESAASAASNEQ